MNFLNKTKKDVAVPDTENLPQEDTQGILEVENKINTQLLNICKGSKIQISIYSKLLIIQFADYLYITLFFMTCVLGFQHLSMPALGERGGVWLVLFCYVVLCIT
jgi:hypothetical protein